MARMKIEPARKVVQAMPNMVLYMLNLPTPPSGLMSSAGSKDWPMAAYSAVAARSASIAGLLFLSLRNARRSSLDIPFMRPSRAIMPWKNPWFFLSV